MPTASTDASSQLRLALRHWRQTDPVMAKLAQTYGARPFPRGRRSGFESLATSLLHQQVSMAAGRSITRRLQAACGGRITPAGVAGLDARALRACGVSRQKAAYLADLARRTLAGEIVFQRLARMSDDEVIATLTRVKGIGTWTAKMFLLFHLRRPDIVAPEDLGLRLAVARAYRVPMPRTQSFMLRQQKAWSPYGSLASVILWAHKDAPARR